MIMSFMKLSISILIFKALHFSIKLALKKRNKIDDIENLCNISASTLCIALIYSLNSKDDFLSFKKLRVHSNM